MGRKQRERRANLLRDKITRRLPQMTLWQFIPGKGSYTARLFNTKIVKSVERSQ